jgi:CxxC motif-containing protein (DUF1111 family)
MSKKAQLKLINLKINKETRVKISITRKSVKFSEEYKAKLRKPKY